MSKNFRSDIYEGGITVNPTNGAGIVAPIGTLLPRAGFSPVEFWQKYGALATDWLQVVNNNLGQIQGMSTLSNNLTTLTIMQGRCRSSDGTFEMEIGNLGITASLTLNLDVGVVAPNTWYHVYVIGDSTGVSTIASRISLSSVAPGLPAGFNKFRRVGAIRTDGASNLIPFQALAAGQYRLFLYSAGETTRQVLVNGAATGVNPTLLSLATLVPPTTQFAWIQARQDGTPQGQLFDSPAVASPIVRTVAGGSSNQLNDLMLTDPAQAIGYSNGAVGGLLQVWVSGFSEAI